MRARDAAAQSELGLGFSLAQGDAHKLKPLLPKLGELRYYRRFLEEASAIEDDLALPAPS
jgi:molecular chaperone HscB